MKKIFAIICVMFFLTGCISAPYAEFQLPQGAIYTDIKAPLTTKFHDKKFVKDHGNADSIFIKIYYLGFSFGDNSLERAIKNGLLKKASYVDYEWKSVLGMFGRLIVKTYGTEQPKKD